MPCWKPGVSAMTACELCGEAGAGLVPAGEGLCLDCMDDWDIEQVNLGLVADDLLAMLEVQADQWWRNRFVDAEEQGCVV